ncbi:hypothetical protein CEE34_06705 [Candidatus Aerophobetes bacterium Ae_b3a]|nr:MAG: hypothetical protein CEE34_06705 [Candidatus Aerophobetes bacterium Ae_b3a]
MSYNDGNVKIIADELKWAKDKRYSTALLLGAGMSVSAGIPLARDMIAEVKRQFPHLASTCERETYPAYMGLLAPAQRRKLIGSLIDNAKINLAHLYLGALVKENYIDRILTTNFDPLVIRSLALFNLYPAVYDFAASQAFISGEAAQLSVFYLHGQRDGFVLLNTEEEINRHSEKVKYVFHDVARGRCWIVIGYSGENDPVFERLGEVGVFQNKLFWVGYKEEEPKKHVLEKILEPRDKFGYYVKGYDADSFFLELAKELNLPEPQIISRPFSHLKEAINTIAEFSIDDKLANPTKETKKWIDTAIKGFEERKGFEHIAAAQKSTIDIDEMIRKTRDIWVHGRFSQIDQILDSVLSSGIVEANQYLAFALNNWGNALLKLAKTKEGEEAEVLSKQFFEKYEPSLKLKLEESLDIVSIPLSDLARTKEGEEAEALFKQSFEKYGQSLKIKRDQHEALNNWGNALSDFAKTKEGEEAEVLFKQSFEKYEQSLKIKPDQHEALYDWGNALSDFAKTKEGEEAEVLFKQSLEKLVNAEEIKEGVAAYNLACIYALLGKIKKSLIWLEKGLKLEPTPSRKHILADSDLDNIKDTDDFKRLINLYRPE